MREPQMLISLVLITAIVEACGDSAGPDPTSPPPASATVASPTTSGLFDDAEGRIIPAMHDHRRGLELAGILRQLSTACERADELAARRALVAARTIVAQLEDSEHPANLAALRLSLSRVEALLTETDSE